MSKMNYRRGGKGARRGKTPARFVPNGFMINAKKIHRRAISRCGKVDIAVALAIEGDYVQELKARGCVRLAKQSARSIAVWGYV